MERKIFGQGSRFGSPKEHLLKMIRLIRGSGTVDLGASSCADVSEDQGQFSFYNPQAYKTLNQFRYEFEKTKAMVVIESRHEKWKAGGPL